MTPTLKAAPWLADQLDELQADPEFLADDLVMDVCEQICAALDEAGMKRKDLAERLGVSKSAVSQLLSGDQNVSLRRLVEVALAIGDGYAVVPPQLVPFDRPVVEAFGTPTSVHAEFAPPLDQTAAYWNALCTTQAHPSDAVEGRWYVPGTPGSVSTLSDAALDRAGSQDAAGHAPSRPSYGRAS